jgi:hypothetical protein
MKASKLIELIARHISETGQDLEIRVGTEIGEHKEVIRCYVWWQFEPDMPYIVVSGVSHVQQV